MKKIACLFPGIGYTCDKPLMYYSRKLLRGMGWDVVPVPYSGFPDKVRGDAGRMRQSARMALEQAGEILRKVDWSGYGDILFIGKSVGTVACAAYAVQRGLRCRQVLFTPLEETFRFADGNAIAFHGTADPWADNEVIRECCRRMRIPLYETEGADHSLETGDVDRDIAEMRRIMGIVKEYARQG